MNDSNHNTSQQNLLHLLFQECTSNLPDQIAIILGDEKISYLELDKRSNKLAWQLRQMGIGKGNVVGLLLERSDNVYLIMLAILKSGAAYVPVDPDYPLQRISYILSDCQAKLLITTTNFITKYPSLELNPHYLFDQEQNKILEQSSLSIDPTIFNLSQEDLCYIIYTSGSTGKPKGVEITHHNVCSFVKATRTAYKLTPVDRVYQGFSVAFDASIEEIWLTLTTGATLIPAIDPIVRTGGGLIEFLSEHKISFLSCVPTLLEMLEPPISSLRLLVVGGEVCPQELITRWHTPDLRILNTYGPTEATVVTTYDECSPDESVSLGRPLPGYEVFILDPELNQVLHGEEGELYIGGTGLAKGYVNRPDLNKTKFILHPGLNKRLYRSGDLGRILPNKKIEYLGRVDSQIKLRGFRIELEEIEEIIIKYEGISQVTTTVRELTPGIQSLIAYIVPDENITIDEKEFLKFLHDRLPNYMVPHLFEIMTKLPLLPSGKVDRKNLPQPKVHQNVNQLNYVAPQTDLEQKIVLVWEKLFNRTAISVTADFFYDFGGHSLLAAKAVSILRKDPEMSDASILDIYKNNTIRLLAAKLSLTRNHKISNNDTKIINDTKKDNWRYYLCGLAQFFGYYLQIALLSWQFLLAGSLYISLNNLYEFFSVKTFILGFSLAITLPIISVLVAALLKWLILGKIKAGNYKLWGWYYLRWWLVHNIQAMFVPVNYLLGSPLINIYYRLMGATIGKNCYIGTSYIKAYDLLTIGDNSSIGHETNMIGYIVEDGWLKIGTITIGNDCFIGVSCSLALNTMVQDNSVLEDLSMLPDDFITLTNGLYQGSPAQQYAEHKTFSKEPLVSYPKWDSIKSNLYYYFALLLIEVMYTITLIPMLVGLDYFYHNGLILTISIAAPLVGISTVLLVCIVTIIVKKTLMGKLTPGNYSITSFDYLCWWVVDRFKYNSYISVLSDSLFLPILMRFLGAKIGKKVEIGRLPLISPDLLTIGDRSLTAEFVIIGAPRIYNGFATFKNIFIGNQTFIGNSALLPPGTKLGDNCLVGCLSTVPNANSDNIPTNNTAWIGSPAIFLPQREQTAKIFSDMETYNPTLSLYLKRLSIESIRVILPAIFSFIYFIAYFYILILTLDNFSFGNTMMLLPAFAILIIIIMALSVVAFKWILVGKLHPMIKPLWCTFIWKYDIIIQLCSEFLWPMLSPLMGTPFLAIFCRLFGAKIGKRTYIGTTEFTEFDLITIGDDVSLNERCCIQNHLYEDRIFKMSTIIINDGCNIGNRSIVLYDTEMASNSSLCNLSLLMKGEHLPSNTKWQGIPAQIRH